MDKELQAIQIVVQALDGLDDPQTVARVIAYVTERYGIRATTAKSVVSSEQADEPTFSSAADVFEAARPSGDQAKALCMAYWFQDVQGQADWDAQSINTELKHLGYGQSNITTTLDRLIAKRPQLVIQTRKSGTTKQARKKYKLTREGAKAVDRLLAGTNEDEVGS